MPRPPTVKADDLKNMELADDDDEGWAGHHEDVDYTKEVIFSDSSDDEATPKATPKESKPVCWYVTIRVHDLTCSTDCVEGLIFKQG